MAFAEPTPLPGTRRGGETSFFDPHGWGVGGETLGRWRLPEELLSSGFQMPEALSWLSDWMPPINVPAPGGVSSGQFADISGVVPQGQMPDFSGPGFAQDVPGGSEFFDQIMSPPGVVAPQAPWDFTGTPAPAWSEPAALPGTGEIPVPDGFGQFIEPSAIPDVGEPTVQVFNDPGLSAGVVMPQDVSQSPGDVFGGLQDVIPAFTEPGALGDPATTGGVDAGGSAEFPSGSGIDAGGASEFPSAGSGVDGSGSAEFPSDAAAPQDSPTVSFNDSAPAPDSLPSGMMPGMELGVFAPGGPFSTPGLGPTFSSPGIGARFDSSMFDPGVGMFGLGAMNAAGGSGVSMTGAGYGDQFSRASSGADQGFGDLGAIQDFLDSKEANHLANDPSWVPLIKAAKSLPSPVGTSNHFGWGGSNLSHFMGVPSSLATSRAIALGGGKK